MIELFHFPEINHVTKCKYEYDKTFNLSIINMRTWNMFVEVGTHSNFRRCRPTKVR